MNEKRMKVTERFWNIQDDFNYNIVMYIHNNNYYFLRVKSHNTLVTH